MSQGEVKAQVPGATEVLRRSDEPATQPRERWDSAISERARLRAIRIASIVGLVLALIFVAVNARRGSILGIVTDLIVVAALSGNLLLLRRGRHTLMATVIGVVAVLAITLSLAPMQIVQAYLWAYLLPGMVFFLLGVRRGILANAILSVVLLGAMLIWPPRGVGTMIELSLLMSFAGVLVFALATEQVRFRLERELWRLSSIDPLTGAWNRRRFDERLDEELPRVRRYGRPLSVILFDVDEFKRVNDAHGHAVGDEVLERISRLTRSLIRSTDFFARLGGDEFVVLTPETPAVGSADDGSPGGAVVLAEKLRLAVEQSTGEGRVPVSITLGVGAFIEGDDSRTLLARADAALYRAKEAGRNRVGAPEAPAS